MRCKKITEIHRSDVIKRRHLRPIGQMKTGMKHNDSQTAFLKLIDEHKRLIYKVGLLYADNDIPLEDTCQDIILNLWKAFPHFRGESQVSTWIYRIALNTCMSELRKKQSRPTTVPLTCDIDTLLDDSQDYRRQVLEMYRLIGKLSKLERAVVLLWLDGKSYDEIATIMGIRKGNVGVKLTRIKDKLQKMSDF